MNPNDDAMIAIFQQLSADEADLCVLLLTAAGIEHRVVKFWAGWSVAVRPADLARAMAGIEAYHSENPDTPSPAAAPAARALRQASW